MCVGEETTHSQGKKLPKRISRNRAQHSHKAENYCSHHQTGKFHNSQDTE